MRFYAAVQDCVHENLYEIVDEPWNVFATDLLYFLACEYETGWRPYKVGREEEGYLTRGPKEYTPHPLSPFTNDMRRTIKYGILAPDTVFEAVYDKIVPPGAEDKLARLVYYLTETLNEFFMGNRTMKEVYIMLFFVGKLATIFYLHEVFDAPNIAHVLIANSVLKLAHKIPNGKAFEVLKGVGRLLRMGYEREKLRKTQ